MAAPLTGGDVSVFFFSFREAPLSALIATALATALTALSHLLSIFSFFIVILTFSLFEREFSEKPNPSKKVQKVNFFVHKFASKRD